MRSWTLKLLLAGVLGQWSCVHGVQGAASSPSPRDGKLDDLVSWDKHSFSIRGERLMLYSGEFHPWRLPVPDLWLDILQKIKALGFTGVSFYTYWGLVEGNPGHFVADGIWDLDPFFSAAAEAGIYLIARTGPYINAETAAGGFPGWALRIPGVLRSFDEEYLNATENYVKQMGQIIAAQQITHDGPVVLFQPENEYTTWPGVEDEDFPTRMNKEYMEYVQQQYKDAGIEVPMLMNDNEVLGSFAPGTGVGELDIYAIDAYPMRYDCSKPDVWPTYRFPRDWQLLHQQQSPTTPFSIAEFQGGSGTGWGNPVNQDQCNALVNEEAVRVVYKHNYSFGVKLVNVYMTYGGTNWGNLGYHGGDTSYDYGAAIAEDRRVFREKYSELKLEANFLKVSPAYLTAVPGNASNGSYVDTDHIATTPLWDSESHTNFYVVRHADFTSLEKQDYKLQVPSSLGNLTIPQLGGSLTLFGRDSKVHVTDYDVGGINLIYSSAEIMTWAKDNTGRRVLILYGGADELHEIALPRELKEPELTEGSDVTIKGKGRGKGRAWVIQWTVAPERRVVTVGKDLEIHLLWRNDAYTHWVMELPAAAPVSNYSSPSKEAVIVKGGYLLRNANIDDTELRLTGDINATTDFEVVFEPTRKVSSLSFNGGQVEAHRSDKPDRLSGTVSYDPPALDIPDFTTLSWKYHDSLPEIRPEYDDSLWIVCDHPTSTNPLTLRTPKSLYASDYGYHTSSLLYRGHFKATGNEASLFLNATGGAGCAYSVWVGSSFLGSTPSHETNSTYALSFPLPELEVGADQVISVLIDHMGQDMEAPGTDAIKFPRGLLDYDLDGHDKEDVIWKMTGNLGGEDYIDLTRGPRNEGALYAERQGWHLPGAPVAEWKEVSPFKDGADGAGVGFFVTQFDLSMPENGWDIPLAFEIRNNTETAGTYRAQLFVNGYQFATYVSDLGPQNSFPVPEGILNYNGNNYVALTLWSLEEDGATLGGLELVPQAIIKSGYSKPRSSPQPGWKERKGAY